MAVGLELAEVLSDQRDEFSVLNDLNEVLLVQPLYNLNLYRGLLLYKPRDAVKLDLLQALGVQ